MISLKGNEITMTRSDSLILNLSLFNKDGTEYVPIEGDYIRFAMSTGYLGDVNYILHINKEIPIDTMILELEPEDTHDLAYVKYNYDIEITHADGRVDTFISSTLKLVKEVK